jgi:hypothetical protein
MRPEISRDASPVVLTEQVPINPRDPALPT